MTASSLSAAYWASGCGQRRAIGARPCRNKVCVGAGLPAIASPRCVSEPEVMPSQAASSHRGQPPTQTPRLISTGFRDDSDNCPILSYSISLSGILRQESLAGSSDNRQPDACCTGEPIATALRVRKLTTCCVIFLLWPWPPASTDRCCLLLRPWPWPIMPYDSLIARARPATTRQRQPVAPIACRAPDLWPGQRSPVDRRWARQDTKLLKVYEAQGRQPH